MKGRSLLELLLLLSILGLLAYYSAGEVSLEQQQVLGELRQSIHRHVSRLRFSALAHFQTEHLLIEKKALTTSLFSHKETFPAGLRWSKEPIELKAYARGTCTAKSFSVAFQERRCSFVLSLRCRLRSHCS